MIFPYTTMAAKENQQPNSADSGVKRRLAMGPSKSPNSTGSVDVLVIRLASRNRFRIGYPCTDKDNRGHSSRKSEMGRAMTNTPPQHGH